MNKVQKFLAGIVDIKPDVKQPKSDFQPNPIIEGKDVITYCEEDKSRQIKLMNGIRYHKFFLPPYTIIKIQKIGRWFIECSIPQSDGSYMPLPGHLVRVALSHKSSKVRLL